jgi:L,D-transpeptidase ErfK/SrfK
MRTLLTGIAGILLATGVHAQGPALLDIDLSERTLTYVADTTLTFPIATGGKGYETPTGEYAIKAIARHPKWCPDPDKPWLTQAQRDYVTENGCIPYGDKLNPLREYFLLFDPINGLGLHGSFNPYFLQRQGSHGCIRMNPEDIKELVEKHHLKKGTILVIHE